MPPRALACQWRMSQIADTRRGDFGSLSKVLLEPQGRNLRLLGFLVTHELEFMIHLSVYILVPLKFPMKALIFFL